MYLLLSNHRSERGLDNHLLLITEKESSAIDLEEVKMTVTHDVALVIAALATVGVILFLIKLRQHKIIARLLSRVGLTILILVGAIVFFQHSEEKNMAAVFVLLASVIFLFLFRRLYQLFRRNKKYKPYVICLLLAALCLLGAIAYLAS